MYTFLSNNSHLGLIIYEYFAFYVVFRYELFVRSGCPQPYSDPTDPVTIPCNMESAWQSKAKGLIFSTHIDQLQPYSAYDFRLQAYNKAGALDNPPVIQGITLPAREPHVVISPSMT